ncbi:MAG TPA: efflux RND transporter periplasmic adaptor subunit [Burkholderiaceae bacterium]|nr:efflux RND transporter periplasmic adaptor subunit [Burkholderiaceae bacterium]
MPIARIVLAALAAALLVACGRSAPDGAHPAAAASAPATAKAPADAPVLLLSPEDLRTVRVDGADGGGPVITGSIQPDKRADLRAEVAAVVTQVAKDNGESVKRGDLLMRLDDTSMRESLQSAEAGARAAQQAFDQAQRQVERLKTLQAQGMTSVQALDDAEGRRNAAQSELVAARARVVSAQQQLRRTEVRAPFDGVVSERKASVGDTAQVGKELLKVIDPRSMRFDGLVSADRMAEVRPGQPVRFRVNGVEGVTFDGKVQRVDATANSVTRQVAVQVAFADPAQAPRVAGLYAEGRIETGAVGQPMLPESSIVRSGDAAFVWRVGKDGKLGRVPVQLGERDARSGELALKGGLAEGDQILRNPRSTLVEGQRVEFVKAVVSAASAAK